MIDIVLVILGVIILVLLVAVLGKFSAVQKEIKESRVETIQYINNSFKNFGDMVSGNQKEVTQMQDKRLAELSERFRHMTMENEQKLENIRNTMSQKIVSGSPLNWSAKDWSRCTRVSARCRLWPQE